jgi:hypothetical protein
MTSVTAFILVKSQTYNSVFLCATKSLIFLSYTFKLELIDQVSISDTSCGSKWEEEMKINRELREENLETVRNIKLNFRNESKICVFLIPLRYHLDR